MSIQTDIRNQMKEAMIAKDAVRLNVLRGLLSAFTNENVAKKRKPDEPMSDEDAMNVITRAVTQRKDSIEQFGKANRTDLVDTEKSELTILETFLPPQMSEEEVVNFIKAKQTETGMSDPTKKNQFMGLIMKELKGKADSAIIKETIDDLFT